jgi:hypothetical protein
MWSHFNIISMRAAGKEYKREKIIRTQVTLNKRSRMMANDYVRRSGRVFDRTF